MNNGNFVNWYIPEEILEMYKDYIKKPLTAEENIELFKKWHDENDPTARETIILGNLKLVFACAKKYIPLDAAYTNDDIISVGTIGLIRAVDTYDYHKEYAFSSYAYKVIGNELIRLYKKYLQEKLVSSLDIAISSVSNQNDADEDATLLDTLVDPAANFEDQLTKDSEVVALVELVRDRVDKLTRTQQEVVSMYFGLDGKPQMTVREIAKARGTSFQAADVILLKSLQKIRTYILLYLKFE